MSLLDLPDIQGNIHRPYGRDGFPYARHLLFNVGDAEAGRAFIEEVRHYVTTSEPWENSRNKGQGLRKKPYVAMNIALTWEGLRALGVPTRTLAGMPSEFIEGMTERCGILGDVGPSATDRWDDVWQPRPRGDRQRIHLMITLHAQANPAMTGPHEQLQVWTDWLLGLIRDGRYGVAILAGHGSRNGAGAALWQDSNALMQDYKGRRLPTPMEHFGFRDGISDPTFEGQSENPDDAIGFGKLVANKTQTASSWAPLATGEFILGSMSEGQEQADAGFPRRFFTNGTFMAVRKLHQNVGSWNRAMAEHAARYQAVAGIADAREAEETLKAKMVGRWKTGVPLVVAPTWQRHQEIIARYPALALVPAIQAREHVPSADELRQLTEFDRLLVDFRYSDDPLGKACPFGAHVRRANPRDMLDPQPEPGAPTTFLTNRRRIMRRGLPYGETTDDDDGEHGVFIMALCTDLFRQFEFVQQQWMQYGLDFDAGNDTCPIIGNRAGLAKFVVPADEARGTPPYIAAHLPTFVETRGGEYFFVPSLTALRMIAMGTIDPT